MMDARGLLKLERRATHEPLGIVKAGDHTGPGRAGVALAFALRPDQGVSFRGSGIGLTYGRSRVYILCVEAARCVATGGVYFVMFL